MRERAVRAVGSPGAAREGEGRRAGGWENARLDRIEGGLACDPHGRELLRSSDLAQPQLHGDSLSCASIDYGRERDCDEGNANRPCELENCDESCYAREQNAFGRVLGRLHSSDSSLDIALVESYRFRHAEWMIPDAWKWDRGPTDEGGWPQDQKAGHSQHEFEGVRPFPSSGAKKNFHRATRGRALKKKFTIRSRP